MYPCIHGMYHTIQHRVDVSPQGYTPTPSWRSVAQQRYVSFSVGSSIQLLKISQGCTSTPSCMCAAKKKFVSMNAGAWFNLLKITRGYISNPSCMCAAKKKALYQWMPGYGATYLKSPRDTHRLSCAGVQLN